ncbi:MAG: hypothetical protein KME15_05540 [Drouetiella hepatica Uher 2000/2452]|jgi:hypothetical protein|uniref:Uncharacterized protein n=1 Tax=Drouetiella hepatica Uher 2000/2452 TaxID=904376 RepID=A0A951ULC5_9CYAN|nr:hypothetical protein [Drouetiella hepatica Uher 2000/2452]
MLPQRPPVVILAPRIEQDVIEQDLAIAVETPAARHSTQLGRILLKNRMVLPSQLGAALAAQMLYSKKLGEVLIERQLISEEQLGDALREQLLRRRGHWVI